MVERSRTSGTGGRWRRSAAPVLLALAALAATAAGTGSAGAVSSDGAPGGYQAEVRRTAYGVPHVQADDYAGIGFGIGKAFAQDDVCLLADRMLTVRGERSRYLGPEGGNLDSDVFNRRLVASGELEALLAGDPSSPSTPSEDARALVRGFAAGASQHIRSVGVDNIDDPRCRGAAWVREFSELDYWRSVLLGNVPVQVGGTANAAPPAVAARVAADDVPVPADVVGSNAYGLGREVTTGGRGVLLANPHYPWDGQLRFYRSHFRIPGELNVVGAGLVSSPVIGIGHNASMAWTHTVSTARRAGYFELTLAPGAPTSYVYEGEVVPMTETTVTVPVRQADGSVTDVRRTLYGTRFGAVVETPTFPWTATTAFAVRPAPEGVRVVDQYLAIWQAEDVRELFTALSRFQATGYNTTAADATGEVFYGDMGAVPHVTDAKAEACIVSATGRAQWAARTPVLDGSRAECEWGTDPDAVVPGIFGPSALPHLFRTDYVVQSNDSYWLTNPEEPLTGFPRILGDEQTERSLRTRLALEQVEQRIAGTDGLAGKGFDLKRTQRVLFGNRNKSAELARDELVAACRATRDQSLAPACRVLGDWDLREDVDSRGAHVWRIFAASGGLRWSVPFDPADPLGTPRDLATEDPRVLGALRTAVATLRSLGVPLDAPLGDVQTEQRGNARIPIHGGPGTEGIFNAIYPTDPQPGLGFTSIAAGSSWIMTVEFTDDGPRSEGVLAYSQSTNPLSPHFADQTLLYSREGWDDLRFTRAAVVEGTVRRSVVREGAGDCRRGGWQAFGSPDFRSQAECLAWFRGGA
jgi:acyl-homoserine-lactone acylase